MCRKAPIGRHCEAWLALVPLQGKEGERQKRLREREKKTYKAGYAETQI